MAACSGYVPALLEVALTVYCLLDAIRNDRATIRYLPKLAWVLIIVLVPIVGDVAWLVAGRPRHDTDHGPQDAQIRPRGPDDDPDFLTSI